MPANNAIVTISPKASATTPPFVQAVFTIRMGELTIHTPGPIFSSQKQFDAYAKSFGRHRG